jgi:hypothetical protein
MVHRLTQARRQRAWLEAGEVTRLAAEALAAAVTDEAIKSATEALEAAKTDEAKKRRAMFPPSEESSGRT